MNYCFFLYLRNILTVSFYLIMMSENVVGNVVFLTVPFFFLNFLNVFKGSPFAFFIAKNGRGKTKKWAS